MDGFDLKATRLIRLEQDVEAWFSGCDMESQQKVLGWFKQLARMGYDPLTELRASHKALFGSELRCPTPIPPPATPLGDDELELEPLPAARRATLWPYRPKRLPDELLSSWLWRVASGLGAPPSRFALDAIGVRLADVDRDIDDAAIARLAFLSGQPHAYLLRGTLRPDVVAAPGDVHARVQQVLLRNGDLVLNRQRGGRGRSVPITSYCPVCLASKHTAYLRRGWRFSIEIACSRDGCFLMDSCWRCGALLDSLSGGIPCDQFLCCKCSAPLAKAPSLRVSDMVQDQALVYSHLDTLIRQCSPDPLGYPAEPVIGRLSAGDLRGTNPANPADRHNAVMMEAWDLLHPAARRPSKQPAPTRQGRRAKRSGPQQRQQPNGSVGIAEVQKQDGTLNPGH